jgi:hypothetical protein
MWPSRSSSNTGSSPLGIVIEFRRSYDNNDVNGDGATGNEVDNDGDSATGDDNNDNGNDNDDGNDGDGDGVMGSSAMEYNDDGDGNGGRR